jgi:hypothetical protein
LILSKRKKIIISIISLVFLACVTSLALAETGHFKLLAKALHISADTTSTFHTVVQVSGASKTGVDGTYAACGQFNGEPIYYQIIDGKLSSSSDIKSLVIAWNSIGPNSFWAIGLNTPYPGFGLTRISPIYYNSYYPPVGTDPSEASGWVPTIGPDGGGALAPTITSSDWIGSDCTFPQTFEIDGYVKNSSDHTKVIANANVIIGGKETTTDSQGYFKLPDITYTASAGSNYSLAVSQTGYKMTKPQPTLGDYLGSVSPGSLSSINIYMDPTSTPPVFDNIKFNLRGQILKADGVTPLEGVTVKVSCATSCGVGPWQTTSANAFSTSADNLHKYNYDVSGIYNIDQSVSSISALNIELDTVSGTQVTKLTNYLYYLKGWNNYASTATPLLPQINKNGPTLMQTYINYDGQNIPPINVAYQDFKMKPAVQVPKDATISGKVTDNKGVVLRNIEVFAKFGGFPKPLNITKKDFLNAKYNAITDSNGIYKISFPGGDISQAGQYLEVCAFMGQYNLNKYACYTPTPSSTYQYGFNIFQGGNYPNINMTINFDSSVIDWSHFQLFGEINTPDNKIDSPDCSTSLIHQDNLVALVHLPSSFKETEAFCPSNSTVPIDGKRYNYLINNIPILTNSSKITYEIDDERLQPINNDYYLDLNGNWINDDANFIEIKPSDLTKNIFIKDNKLYYRVDLPVKQLYATKDNFQVFGSLVDQGNNPIGEIPVSVIEKSTSYSTLSGTSSSFNYEIPGVDGKYNFDFSNGVYLFNQGMYELKVDAATLNKKGLYLTNPTQSIIDFNASQLNLNKMTNKYYYNINYLVQPKTDDVITEQIQFVDSRTGLNIHLTSDPSDKTKELVTNKDLFCFDHYNNSYPCVVKYEIDKSNDSIVKYTINLNGTGSSKDYNFDKFYLPNFQTTNYIQLSTQFLNYSNNQLGAHFNSVTLISKKDQADSIYCEKLGGINFCTYLIFKKSVFTDTTRQTMAKLGKMYYQISLADNLPEIPDIFVDIGGNSSFVRVNPFNNSKIKSKFIIDLQLSFILGSYIRESIHEMGHIIDDYYRLTDTIPGSHFSNWTPNHFIKFFNIGNSNQCNKKYPQYGCFSNYAMTTNKDEMWAEFFTTWVTQHDQIVNAINDPKVDSKCKNIILFEEKIMRNYFPNMPTYSIKPDHQIINNNIGEVLGASTSTQSIGTFNPTVLNSIMDSFGYQVSSAPTINTDLTLNELLGLTSDQIASGIWLKDNYQNAPLKQKALLQLQILKTKTINLLTQNKPYIYIENQIHNINISIENWLSRIGFNFSSANITGGVFDQNGLLASGLKVTVGSKSAITNSGGVFSISRLQTGSNIVTVSNPKTNKTYTISPNSFTVNPDSSYYVTINLQDGTLTFNVM